MKVQVNNRTPGLENLNLGAEDSRGEAWNHEHCKFHYNLRKNSKAQQKTLHSLIFNGGIHKLPEF